jgi:energy-coupling factor transporter ATP-binding protein EcfA2
VRISGLRVHEVGPFTELSLHFPEGNDPTKADTILLVGPNGAGKSTLLYALAGLFSVQTTELGERFRSPSSSVSVDGVVGTDPFSQRATSPRSDETFDEAVWQGRHHWVHYPHNPWSGLLDESTTDISKSVSSAKLMFAYSGTRTISPANKQNIPLGPLRQALDWSKPYTFETFLDWVKDILGRRNSALVKGEKEDAGRISEGLRRLEDFVSEVVGSPSVFDVRTEDGTIVLVNGANSTPIHLLPEGLKSLLSWMGDLLRRLYSLTTGGVAHHELPIVLLLDEIEVHLHPKWQRLVVPAVERLLPNAQIFMSTHSPFVLASASDAQIVWLSENGTVREDLPTDSLRGFTYPGILELMGIDSLQDVETQRQLGELDDVVAQVRSGTKMMADFELVAELLPQTEDVLLTVDFQRSQLKHLRRTA